ncbi:MAG: hypothetical protein HOO91_15800 [Bacteroidales bacterium]|nr:hypothetical protein [Bacteroidales bacterium]
MRHREGHPSRPAAGCRGSSWPAQGHSGKGKAAGWPYPEREPTLEFLIVSPPQWLMLPW